MTQELAARIVDLLSDGRERSTEAVCDALRQSETLPVLTALRGLLADGAIRERQQKRAATWTKTYGDVQMTDSFWRGNG